jgi:hypothetical protein
MARQANPRRELSVDRFVNNNKNDISRKSNGYRSRTVSHRRYRDDHHLAKTQDANRKNSSEHTDRSASFTSHGSGAGHGDRG